MGIVRFPSIYEALKAGYEILTREPDENGFLLARTIKKPHGLALVKPSQGW